MSWLEVVGTVAGVVCVVLTVRKNLWCWPVGIVSVVAFGVLFFQIRLYADAVLQGFYVVTGFYGWWAWKWGGEGKTTLPVRLLSRGERWLVVGVIVPAIWGVTWVLRTYTDAALPFWDTFASVLSVAAQLLLMRKVFENWVLWIVVDVVSIGIYVTKEVYLTAGLYAVFLVLATIGLLSWRRDLEVEAAA